MQKKQAPSDPVYPAGLFSWSFHGAATLIGWHRLKIRCVPAFTYFQLDQIRRKFNISRSCVHLIIQAERQSMKASSRNTTQQSCSRFRCIASLVQWILDRKICIVIFLVMYVSNCFHRAAATHAHMFRSILLSTFAVPLHLLLIPS